MSKDIFQQIRNVPIDRIDQMISDNMELQDLILRNAELIRLKNLEFFEQKRKLNLAKRELEEAEATTMLGLDDKSARNAELRKAAVILDHNCSILRADYREAETALDEIEQNLWTLRHLESNFKMIAELRIVELKKMG